MSLDDEHAPQDEPTARPHRPVRPRAHRTDHPTRGSIPSAAGRRFIEGVQRRSRRGGDPLPTSSCSPLALVVILAHLSRLDPGYFS